MSPVRIRLETPDQPDIRALIDALDAFQKPLYPPESHHGIDLPALMRPNVLFAVAREATGEALGCGAVVLEPGYAELKRMYVTPEARGRGIGKRLLMFLEEQARSRGWRRLRLETGVRQAEALGMYERAGYVLCAPFGSYVEDPNSVFMEKLL